MFVKAYDFRDKVHSGGKQYYEAVRDPLSHLKYTQESKDLGGSVTRLQHPKADPTDILPPTVFLKNDTNKDEYSNI